MAFERKYMLRAIELAKLGAGAVNPNPLVGAVIVKDGKIIGEGYHVAYGQLHAERDAFSKLTEDAEGAEMYVTLEPCCHYGKQPPCTEAIVEHKIKTVYVGSDDPNEMVCGKGYTYLREHGVEVITNQMKEECDALNTVFFHYITKKIPYVVMKYAMTMDGKIASYTGASKWISNEKSREKVQHLRNDLMGIMVGIGTVLSDDPMLTCRLENGHNPIRIVCDSTLKMPTDCNLVNTAKEVRTIVACGEDFLDPAIADQDKIKVLEEKGVEIIPIACDNGRISLSKLIVKLGEMKIDSILLEGGGVLNFSAIDENLVDEIDVFIAPMIMGGKDAKTPVEGVGFENPDIARKYKMEDMEIIDGDIFIKYKKKEDK